MATIRKSDGKELVHDVQLLGRKLQNVGKTLVKGTGDVAVAAVEETLVKAEDALTAAHKQLRKVRSRLHKRTQPAAK